jgi:hypothetical protein
MSRQRVENPFWMEFKFASPLTAVTLNNLLAAARGMGSE